MSIPYGDISMILYALHICETVRSCCGIRVCRAARIWR